MSGIMSSYIKRRYRGMLDGCIVDELHEYNNDSGQGDAMAEIYSVADRVIGMTATLINGYSSGIFHLLYRVCPGLMMQDCKRHSAPADFDAEYGVVENTYEEDEQDYAVNRRTHRRKTRTRQLPGVSPLVYSRFCWSRPPSSPCRTWVRTFPTMRRSQSRWIWKRRSPRSTGASKTSCGKS